MERALRPSRDEFQVTKESLIDAELRTLRWENIPWLRRDLAYLRVCLGDGVHSPHHALGVLFSHYEIEGRQRRERLNETRAGTGS